MADGTMKKTIAQLTPKFVEIRQHLHSEQELGFQEEKTSKLVLRKG
ncbi:metal-dependent amidase/aminoacylase/carboxypeptidase [Coxiella burnetii]|nr:metal-dependent amidase/aminoacylase/carboxypeptidase [Coxiella burnetii]ACJ20513.1 metal-dependent amidase/aminoacylase/carboxypeptidase [Coxiella burnetii CbuK_Q154]